MIDKATVLGVVLVGVLGGAGGSSAQSAGPKYPTTLVNRIWELSQKKTVDSMFRFYDDGIVVTATQAGGSEELGVPATTTFGWRRWFVRYPKAPALDPHVLCIYGPSEAARDQATCASFLLREDRLVWLIPTGSIPLNQHPWGSADTLRMFDSVWVAATGKQR